MREGVRACLTLPRPSEDFVTTGFILAWALAAAGPAAGSVAAQITNPRLDLAHRIATDPGILAAVLEKNRVPESQDLIQKNDQEWQRNKDFPLRKELTHNACATELRKLVQPDP